MAQKPLKNKATITGHTCDLLEQWTTDPRSPIKRHAAPSGYGLIFAASRTLEILFCPFCGERLTKSEKHPSHPRKQCPHLRELAHEPSSCVFYDRRMKEYMVAGRESLKIRLFFCPLCGTKQRLRRNASDFWKIATAEQMKWADRLEKVTTIQAALQELGPADQEIGPWACHWYPKGIRSQIGVKKGLFYNNLAKTFIIAAIEWLDGTFDVKYYPKEKKIRARR